MKYVKLIEKNGRQKDIFIGALNHDDKYSWIATGCSEDFEKIRTETFIKDEWVISEVSKVIAYSYMERCLFHRDRKMDHAFFEYDSEKKKYEYSRDLFHKTFGKENKEQEIVAQ